MGLQRAFKRRKSAKIGKMNIKMGNVRLKLVCYNYLSLHDLGLRWPLRSLGISILVERQSNLGSLLLGMIETV